MGVSILEGNKAQGILDALETNNLYMAALVENSGGLHFKSWAAIQGLVRAGLHTKLFDKYTQFTVDRVSSVTATTDGEFSVSVTAATFEEAMGEAINGVYEFTFDGATWLYNGEAVEITQYGITITGTPAEGDHIVVHETASEILYDVLGCDYDVPADPTFTHSVTIVPHDCANYDVLAYKKPQALIYVDPTKFPSGLTAGTTYSVTLLNGCYDASTKEDGIYTITPTVNVPAGGAIRHGAMGQYQSNSENYTKARILAGKWTTYDTIANGRATLESNIATGEGDGTETSLGTCSAEDITKNTDSSCNLTRRNAYGSNNYFDSDERNWMNSDGATKDNWFKFMTNFDLPATAAIPGFLYGLDPSLIKVVGKVRKRTYLHAADRTDATKYKDSEELFFPLSMTEVYGSQNDGVYETPVKLDGNPLTIAYPYYVGLADADKIKRYNNVARLWWLRSPYPSVSLNVRYVNSSGALNNGDGASGTYGAVPACAIV